MRPSNFKRHPFGSVVGNNESETIARNIMIILSRTGDTFRQLSWDEYTKERKKDGNFSQKEKQYFDDVKKWCISSESAQLFCKNWKSQCN